MAVTIQDVWNRLQNVYNDINPELTFNPPASEEEIEVLESKLNVTLPEDYKESLRIHNGIDYFPTGELLTTERVYEEWRVWYDLFEKGDIDEEQFANEVDPGDFNGPVKFCMWRRKWIPVVSDCSGNGESLDLDPNETGVFGQVFHHYHDCELRPLLGNSFTEWLDGMAKKIENGHYVYKDGGFYEKEVQE